MKTVTASMLVIGDEILSGRTKDVNIGYVADFLTLRGIDLREARIVSDEIEAIASAVNALRASHTYLFTSGGIGPTHDDITADAVSQAFGLPCIHDPRAMALLETHYARAELEFTDARKRMARMPEGAELIDNPVSKAPGFRIENVYVMAGVPKVMRAMMDSISPGLKGGVPIISRHVDCLLGEGTIGGPLTQVQADHSDTMIGSYPRFENGKATTQIVVRGRDEIKVSAAVAAVEEMLNTLR